jgi:hypothetical protein
VDGAEPQGPVFVSLSRNRTGALSPRNKNGALRQFVTKAFSATPELAFLAGTAAGGNDIGVYMAALRASAKQTLTQRSYGTLETQAAATRHE